MQYPNLPIENATGFTTKGVCEIIDITLKKTILIAGTMQHPNLPNKKTLVRWPLELFVKYLTSLKKLN